MVDLSGLLEGTNVYLVSGLVLLRFFVNYFKCIFVATIALNGVEMAYAKYYLYGPMELEMCTENVFFYGCSLLNHHVF